MHPDSHRQNGTTLIELLIALAVLAVLAGLAAPAFGNIAQATHARSARSAIEVTFNQARITAVTRASHVVVCPSHDGLDCDRGTQWQTGWITFVDRNRDGAREANEALIGVAPQQARGLAILSSGGRRALVYRADGSATGTNLTLTFCDRRGLAHASALVVNNAGRIRHGVAPAKTAHAACALAAG
jgi:type IV fimbrial biogenesis protein FimT